MDGKDIINGTWGEVWIDGDKVSECSAFQAKVTLEKADINICGKLAKAHKIIGTEGKGTMKLHKVSSRMIIKVSDNIKKGKETVCTVISKLADPDSYGAERVVVKDMTIDELTLADWEARKNGEESIPFTFTDWDFLDLITPQ